MQFPVLFLTLSIHLVNPAKILVVLPSPILSHNIIYRTIYKQLSLRGHELVVFTPDPLRENLLGNVKEIDISYLYKKVDNAPEEFYTGIGITYQKFFLNIAEEVLTHPEMKKLVNHPDTKFDLFLVEWDVNPSLGILSERFECPMVGMRSKGLTLDGHDYIGNPTNPAYIPNGLTDFDGEFFSRMHNFLFGIMWRINHYFYVIPQAQALVNSLFPSFAEDVLEIQKNASLILTNTHPVFTGVRPIVPANVEIGGIHLGQEEDPLSKGIQSFLDNAENGAVYVNLGSTNVRVPSLTQKAIQLLIAALSELPYRIIWRWDQTDSTISLNNAFISKWVPQQAILGHPNVKAFVTNGGLQSFFEAVDKQVPMVGIPLYADQHINVRKMKKLGIGERLDINALDKQTLINAVKKVAEKARYQNNIKNASVILHDLPMKPLNKAVWWIEYVLRHKGARHLRSTAIDLDWITYLLLDIIALAALCLLSALVAAFYMIRWLRRKIYYIRCKYAKSKKE